MINTSSRSDWESEVGLCVWASRCKVYPPAAGARLSHLFHPLTLWLPQTGSWRGMGVNWFLLHKSSLDFPLIFFLKSFSFFFPTLPFCSFFSLFLLFLLPGFKKRSTCTRSTWRGETRSEADVRVIFTRSSWLLHLPVIPPSRQLGVFVYQFTPSSLIFLREMKNYNPLAMQYI